jgi:hypothetical protein
MGKRAMRKTPPLTATEKQARAAEAAAVLECVHKNIHTVPYCTVSVRYPARLLLLSPFRYQPRPNGNETMVFFVPFLMWFPAP